MPDYFTRAEAEALLPRLDPLLRELRDLRAELRQVEERLGELQARMRGNGHALQGEFGQLRTSAGTLVQGINERVRQIHAWGVLVKDIETGLVDFPARRAGQDVYLCWRLDEPGVAWWHTIEGGFAARQPLED